MATRYRICVRGQLDSSWSDRMAGLHITVTTDPQGALTTLEGPIRDQSELNGVLDTLNDLNLTLVTVQSLPAPQDGDTGGSATPRKRPAYTSLMKKRRRREG